MSSSLNSVGLAVLYQVLGWVAFAAWSFSFYPQVLLNYKRKSVVGLNFDFLVLNLTKHSSYLIYNAALFFSPFIQQQYHGKYGEKEMIPVAANDVAFSLHAVTLTAFTVFKYSYMSEEHRKSPKFAYQFLLSSGLPLLFASLLLGQKVTGFGLLMYSIQYKLA